MIIDQSSEFLTKNKWNQQRRLEFIDFRLSADGCINRRDLVEYFQISVPQASIDFNRYHEMLRNCNPPRKNLAYDRHCKQYVKTPDFKPLFPKLCSPENYLNDLMLYAQGDLIETRNFFGFTPNIGLAAIKPPRRTILGEVLFNILDAIRGHKAVHINYLSLSSNSNKSTDLLIAPHGLAYDGLRWHVRAYCYDKHTFRDYVLSRIVKCAVPQIAAPNDRFPDPIGNGFREIGTAGQDDDDWNTLVDLVLKANPDLPENARRAIEYDYGIEPNGVVVYPCKKALLFYALQWLKLTKDYECLPPQCRQIVLDNEPEVLRRMAGGN